MMLDLVVKQLGRRKGRTALTIVGVAIGILLVTTLSSFSEGISSTVNTEISLLSGKITITSEGVGFQNFVSSELDEGMLDELSGLSGIDRVTGFMAGSVPGAGSVYGAHISDIDLFDIDVEPEEGRFPEEGADEVMLGYYYAENTGLQADDQLEIRSKRYDIVGVLGITGSREDYGILTSLEPAQEILRMEDKVTVIMVTPVSADEAESVANEVRGLYTDIQVLTEKDAAREAEKFTGQLTALTFAIGSIAALIAGLGIMNVMFMSVRERRKEIGTMKALGATTNEILLEVMLEAIIIALAGEVIGLALSVGAVGAFNSMVNQMAAVITPALITNVTVFALALAVLSGILPAREAARLQPAVVLRYE